MKDLKVTIVQSELHWENIPKNLDMFAQKIKAINEPTDIILLPEMFSTGFTMQPEKFAEKMDGSAVTWMKEIAKRANCVVTGSLVIKENGNYHNRLIWMRAEGSFEFYDKRHLFRYGNEDKHYSAGNKKIIVELNGWKICPLVCYDLRFPIWSRNRFKSGVWDYDILIYVANWPERRNHPWKTLLMARSMENQSYVIGLNRVGNDGNEVYHSGDSAIINFKGEAISKTKAKEESVETVTISYNDLTEFRKSFPVGLDTDQFDLR